eukprot:1752946-Lingulodinium_polyedra.AAC.1
MAAPGRAEEGLLEALEEVRVGLEVEVLVERPDHPSRPVRVQKVPRLEVVQGQRRGPRELHGQHLPLCQERSRGNRQPPHNVAPNLRP